jgi:hypothetical protein
VDDMLNIKKKKTAKLVTFAKPTKKKDKKKKVIN